jgi:hypothetical protein
MVKLIRLTSEDNCNFKANLDDGIEITIDSKIALQNLTFNAEFQVLTIDDSNKEVKFTLNSNNALGKGMNVLSANLTPRSYVGTELPEFYKDLEGALNECLSVVSNIPTNGNVYGNFQVEEEKDRVFIKFKYTPMIFLFNMNESIGGSMPAERDNETTFMDISRNSTTGQTISADTTPTDIINLSNVASISTDNTATLNRYIYPQGKLAKWSPGSAMFMVRIQDLIDHGGTDDEHGFGMGLSFSNLAQSVAVGETAIKTTERDFEIIVSKTNSDYQFISPDIPNTPQAPFIPVEPFKYSIITDPDATTHDHLIIERAAGVITASVWNTEDGAGNGYYNPLFSYKLKLNERHLPLYPYIYIKSGGNNCIVGRPTITMDSLTFVNNQEFQGTGQQQGIGASYASDNAFQAISTNFANLIPTLNNQLFDASYPADTIIAQLQINGDVLRLLGFSPSVYPTNQLYKFTHPQTLLTQGGVEWFGFVLTAEGLKELVNSDNFLVVLDSNQVFSYDSSRTLYGKGSVNDLSMANRGRRFNILATIPKNDNSGFLEYEPNELVYIDFDLSQPQVLKNLELRVLNKNLDPLTTFGISIMTLLIDV